MVFEHVETSPFTPPLQSLYSKLNIYRMYSHNSDWGNIVHGVPYILGAAAAAAQVKKTKTKTLNKNKKNQHWYIGD